MRLSIDDEILIVSCITFDKCRLKAFYLSRNNNRLQFLNKIIVISIPSSLPV